jgi:hypothetical protein
MEETLGDIYDDQRTCGATLILSSIVESMNMAGSFFQIIIIKDV